jgi:hypothetical protein
MARDPFGGESRDLEPFGCVMLTKRVPRFGRVRSSITRNPFEFIGSKRKDPLG